ncbi:MAG: IS66 family transposase zinc-finger binding domain-containing protein [Burkholderiales bacterium]|nr:IS66 family transposase zinc-finger binding domain-containing protein [Burkholderiales bacterium]
MAEKLDYQPGVFTVERHVRGKWVCRCCDKIIQAPVPARHARAFPQPACWRTCGGQVHGPPAAVSPGIFGALADRTPGAVGGRVRRATAAAGAGAGRERATWCCADETPVAMLKPSTWRRQAQATSGRRAPRRWCSSSGTRAGENVREFSRPPRPGRARWCRRLQRLHRNDDQGCDLGAVHGAPDASSTICGPITAAKWVARRCGHQCLFRIERGSGPARRRAQAHTPAQVTAGAGRLPPLAVGTATTGAARIGHDEGDRLQPQSLDTTHPLRRRC